MCEYFFSPNNFKKNDEIFLNYVLKRKLKYAYTWKLNKKLYPEKDKALQLRLNEIDEMEYYFIKEIWEKEIKNKKRNKYISTLDYIDQILLVLSAASDVVSII